MKKDGKTGQGENVLFCFLKGFNVAIFMSPQYIYHHHYYCYYQPDQREIYVAETEKSTL